MSKKQQQPKTCMINSTSQSSVATWFRCGGISY